VFYITGLAEGAGGQVRQTTSLTAAVAPSPLPASAGRRDSVGSIAAADKARWLAALLQTATHNAHVLLLDLDNWCG
jgi:hypothetical protein